MNGGQQALSNQHQNNKNEKNFWVKPIQRPIKKHRTPYKNCRKDKKDFFCIKVKWSEVHTFRIEKKL